MKVTYWIADVKGDAPCYSIRKRTRKAVVMALETTQGNFGRPRKVVVEYVDGFDLISRCLSEGGLSEEELGRGRAINDN
jgi:hypothetical protein